MHTYIHAYIHTKRYRGVARYKRYVMREKKSDDESPVARYMYV